jgi:hypothetical protein
MLLLLISSGRSTLVPSSNKPTSYTHRRLPFPFRHLTHRLLPPLPPPLTPQRPDRDLQNPLHILLPPPIDDQHERHEDREGEETPGAPADGESGRCEGAKEVEFEGAEELGRRGEAGGAEGGRVGGELGETGCEGGGGCVRTVYKEKMGENGDLPVKKTKRVDEMERSNQVDATHLSGFLEASDMLIGVVDKQRESVSSRKNKERKESQRTREERQNKRSLLRTPLVLSTRLPSTCQSPVQRKRRHRERRRRKRRRV